MGKLILLLLTVLTSTGIMSQNITTTLGTGGVYSLKYGSTTFLSLSQADSVLNVNYNLTLSNTTSPGVGVIYKWTNRFLHNYGANNTFLGVNSGNFTMSGIGGNSAFGVNTLYSNTTGNSNSAFGYLSLNFNTTGSQNSAFGNNSLYNNTMGIRNSAFGFNSLYSNTTGNNNTALGYQSLYSNTTGFNNTSLGFYSLYSNTTGRENTAIGHQSLQSNTTGINNIALGELSLFLNTTGNENTALGNGTLFSNSTGYNNTAVGLKSLLSNTVGFRNTSLGHNSLYSNTTGFHNTAVGDSALYLNTGNFNTAIGFNAGSQVTTGANLTLIGIDANPSSPTAIDQITLGNGFVSSLRCNVTTITSLSDMRDKKNIKDLNLGLDFITKLKPRLFNWDKREWYDNNISDGTKMQESPTAGFIAQELDEVQTNANAEWLNLVLKDNPEKWEATPGNLLPIMVKAIQDLKSEKDNEIAKLQTENDELKNKLTKFEQMQNKLAAEIENLKSRNTEVKEVNSTGN